MLPIIIGMCGSGRSYFVELVVRHLADDCMVSDNKHHNFYFLLNPKWVKGFGLGGTVEHESYFNGLILETIIYETRKLLSFFTKSITTFN